MYTCTLPVQACDPSTVYPYPCRSEGETEKINKKTTKTEVMRRKMKQYEEMTMDNNHTDLSAEGSKQALA